jgi:PelA/Pel-15E family pectate lyase
VNQAWEKGLDLLLRCQYVQNGVLTVWAQQHDNQTLQPVKARSFELPGLTANESRSILLLLMHIREPSPEVVKAVQAGVAWMKSNVLEGLRIQRTVLPEEHILNHEYPYDNVAVQDTTAPPIWARFYECDTNRPFLCTRQGKKVYTLAEVDPERRTGYAWYGYWPMHVLKEYPKWLIQYLNSDK